ncbi:flagellin [Paracoccus sp. (in: a-proteobacteria)]|uniref:flagellin n=1 Tax=Paracoccus sp. TaxID=267 RepID=UPI0026DF8A44|nr:flagellin [Paracoccus sp. (in: a-proteobacteria)]MDO5648462.1 flagellin [Paracoccus sp. (in: a-proteobacteria)]
MNLSSIGDQSRQFSLHTQTQRTKDQIADLTKQVTTGEYADMAAQLRGNTRGLSDIESKITLLGQAQSNLTEAAQLTDLMQHQLNGVHQMTSDLSLRLIGFQGASSIENTDAVQSLALTSLDIAVARLNATVGGRYAFSATRPDQPSLISAPQLLDAARQAAEGADTAADIIAAVTAWFDAPVDQPGYLRDAYGGSVDAPVHLPLGQGATTAITLSAASDPIRDALKALTLAALAQDYAADQPDIQHQMLGAAGAMMLAGDPELVGAQGRLGAVQQQIEAAQVEARSYMSTLELARNDIRGADVYRSSTELTEVQSQLEAIYALTARLSRLKLVDFLR